MYKRQPQGGPNCSPFTTATVTVAIEGDSEYRDITYYGRSGRGSDLTFINADDVSTSQNVDDRSFTFEITGLVPSDYVFSFRDECGFTYESAEVPTYTCEPIESPYNRNQIFGDISVGLRNGSCYNSDGALWWDSQTELEIDLSGLYRASPSCLDYTIEWPGYDANGSDEDNEGLMTTIGAEGADGETSFDIPGPGSYEIKVSNDLCQWSYTFVVQPSNGLSISGWAVIDQNSFNLRDFNQPVIMGKYLCSTCRNHNEIGTTESYLDICNDTHEKVTYEDLLDNVTPFYFDADDADNPCAGGTFYYVDEDGISQSIEVSGGVQSPISDGAGEAFLNFDCREYAACIFDNLSLGSETPPLPVMAISCVRPSEFVAVYDEILIDEDYLEDETCIGPFVYVPVGECIYNVYCGNNPTQLLEYENGEKAENIEMDQFDVCYTMIDESNCTKNFYCIGPEGYSQLVNVETIPCNTINLESFGQCPY